VAGDAVAHPRRRSAAVVTRAAMASRTGRACRQELGVRHRDAHVANQNTLGDSVSVAAEALRRVDARAVLHAGAEDESGDHSRARQRVGDSCEQQRPLVTLSAVGVARFGGVHEDGSAAVARLAAVSISGGSEVDTGHRHGREDDHGDIARENHK